MVSNSCRGRLQLWSTDATFRFSAELAAWRPSDSMTKHLVPYDHWLLQASGGLLKIWSTETYQLLHVVMLFQRSCDKLVVLEGIVVCCGRDASMAIENDVCGLDEGVKGWKLEWADKNQLVKWLR